MSRNSQDSSGCAAVAVFLLVAALVVGAAISLAAVIDPFSWMPPVAEIWADCEDNWRTDRDECALATRYDGFWAHTVINLVYVAVSAALLLGFIGCVAEFRAARQARFSGGEAPKRYEDALSSLVGASAVVAILAAIPILVAL